LKRFLFAILFGVLAYVVFAVVGYFLILWLSSNMHDRSVEAVMTSAFFIGPIGALCGIVAGIVFGGRRRRPPEPAVHSL
jgi:hypothetical protein